MDIMNYIVPAGIGIIITAVVKELIGLKLKTVQTTKLATMGIATAIITGIIALWNVCPEFWKYCITVASIITSAYGLGKKRLEDNLPK